MIIEVDNIPKTLDETFTYLNEMNVSDLDSWLQLELTSALGQAQHGLGQWIRNNFGLWEEKPNDIKNWFIDNYFLDHPDDISSMILINFHEKMNGKNTNLSKHVDIYHKHWSKNDPKYKLKLRKYKLNKLCTSLNKQ